MKEEREWAECVGLCGLWEELGLCFHLLVFEIDVGVGFE